MTDNELVGGFEDDAPEDVSFEHLRYEVDGEVAIVTIDRQEALNALDQDVLFELGLVFELAAADSAVRALVLTGAGRAFVAGADIAALRELGDAFAGRETSLGGQEVANTLASLPFPTVAAINGFALGGGLELALAADLRVAATSARLGLPEVGLGLIPGFGGTQRLPRLIGVGRALDLILTGRHVQAEEALQLGLVNRVADDALATAVALARQAARNAPIALGLAKEAVFRGLDVTLQQGLEVEADLFGMVATTTDMREGTSAFLEKRAPEWTDS
ncbi:MAG: enoyl-CoA hydratase/isomerase family protein [Trueperaceae bacterium]|nr:enoyl-CoA hydratase/isomerase family protein [Trueperaceae bacterium]MCC6311016.1 enoyl-CoA hydratase/isomerase family protein [Trueperaceae bacterium]MCO5175021.1 enoyl-CoA hydratase-related protein [Trueperaceae bacterium]